MIEKAPLELVLVQWDDIVVDNRWVSGDEVDEHHIAPCETVGWILSDDPTTLKLCSTRDTVTEGFNGVIAIPKGVIRSVARLAVS